MTDFRGRERLFHRLSRRLFTRRRKEPAGLRRTEGTPAGLIYRAVRPPAQPPWQS